MDREVVEGLKNKPRASWGLQNVVVSPNAFHQKQNDAMKNAVARKVARFCATAFYPNQVTFPRDYGSTKTGSFIFKELTARPLKDGIRENGVRVVVQENQQLTRFIMSPLLPNLDQARAWAAYEMGVKL